MSPADRLATYILDALTGMAWAFVGLIGIILLILLIRGFGWVITRLSK